MKGYVNACVMAFSMFCAFPCPCRRWDEEARPLMTLFLPLVGAWIGMIWALAAFLLQVLQIAQPIASAILCTYPFLATGFLHLDGFLDTTDAVKSCRGLEERRRILKDSTCGAFAVVACVLLIIMQFALFLSAKEGADVRALVFIPVISRAMAGLCITVLRPIPVSEYAGGYRQGIRKTHIAVYLLVLVAAGAGSLIFLGRYSLVSLATAVGYLLAVRRGFKSLEGMSGDISGYALTIGELFGIAVYALI